MVLEAQSERMLMEELKKKWATCLEEKKKENFISAVGTAHL